jgi:MOSC domain-containing protein YiiM
VSECGEVVSIWIKPARRLPMKSVESADLVAARGLAGSANQGGRRQITIIDESAWRDAVTELGVDVDPSARRANVMLRGIDLENSRGRYLLVGTALIRVFGETTPCRLMDEAQHGLRAALRPHWRGGISGEILEGGTIRLGDRAEWVEGTLF